MFCELFLVSERNRRTAFTAILKTDVRMSKYGVFKFDKVEVNQGNNYNPNTGVFTAPSGGLYHFSCTILLNGSGSAFFNLMKNNDIYIKGFIVPTSNDSQTQSVMMDLEKGDRVYVKTGSSFGVQKEFTYFSGYLL